MDENDVLVVDEDFLAQIEAAEATAASIKRRKTNGVGVGVEVGAKREEEERERVKEEEGSYTAALRGSRSNLWQQQQQARSYAKGGGRGGSASATITLKEGQGGGGSGDACFKCGQLGHWSRDCTVAAAGGGGGGGGNSNFPAAMGVPDKACPCGLGMCLVFTANTEKNRGRKFYRCPVRDENGGCGHFDWCDSSSTPTSAMAQSNTSNSSFPVLPCPCGAGSCLILTAKKGNNVGEQFYRCPANQENFCKFFKWCKESLQTTNASKFYTKSNDANDRSYGANDSSYGANNKSYGEMSGSSCFKCSKTGHWARDCPNQLSASSNTSVAGRPASSSTCYKCGKPGHWANSCPG